MSPKYCITKRLLFCTFFKLIFLFLFRKQKHLRMSFTICTKKENCNSVNKIFLETSGSDKFYRRLNYTCEETTALSTTGTKMSDCLVNCVADPDCYAFIYKAHNSDKCLLMKHCTPKQIDETQTGTANWVNITLFIKESRKL